MILKQRIGDFRVRELLREGYLRERGQHRVYRVTKRKLTTPEAIGVLAQEAGVDASEIGIAGYKDRQAITIQYMSVPRGRSLRLRLPELRVDEAGFADEPLSSEFSRGNAFELNVRGLYREDVRRLRRSLPAVREHGLVDYFDDQRFGNLRHGQGWIVQDLMLGRHEQALRSLLAAPSTYDDDRHRAFKRSLERSWGDWRACRDAAGRFGAHHSVFEHLGRSDGDFAGAFTYIASRVRLIHLYAWQSHLWNRAVVDFVRREVPLEQRVLIDSEEGTLVAYAGAPPPALANKASFRLPGEGLEDVQDPVELAAFEEVLAGEKMVADQLRVTGVSGFQLKGEPRPLLVRPQHLRVRPSEEDPLNRGAEMVRIRFELPRGAYASLVVKRLFAGARSGAQREGSRRGGERSGRGRSEEGRGRSVRDRSSRREESGGRWDRGGEAQGRPGGRSGRGENRDRGSDRRDRGGSEGSWGRGRGAARGDRSFNAGGSAGGSAGGRGQGRGESGRRGGPRGDPRGDRREGGPGRWRGESQGDRGAYRGGGTRSGGWSDDSRGERQGGGAGYRRGGARDGGGRRDSRDPRGAERGGGGTRSGWGDDSRGERQGSGGYRREGARDGGAGRDSRASRGSYRGSGGGRPGRWREDSRAERGAGGAGRGGRDRRDDRRGGGDARDERSSQRGRGGGSSAGRQADSRGGGRAARDQRGGTRKHDGGGRRGERGHQGRSGNKGRDGSQGRSERGPR